MRFLVFILVFSLLLVPSGYKRLTGGFRVEKMKSHFPFRPEWELNQEGIGLARKILDQPFHYLDRGSQCYVFVSEDDQYVIKLFRFDQQNHIVQKVFHDFFFHRKKRSDREWKGKRLLNASKLAFERVPFETGLVYVQLNTGNRGLPNLYCKDSLGRRYRLSLDNYRFVLQKKAEPLRQFLIENLKNPDRMKKSIDSIFSLLKVRTAKTLYNSDSNLSRNLGFLDGRAIEIDFGNYCDCPDLNLPRHRIEEIDRFCLPLRDWIKGPAPEWASYIDEEREKLKREMLRK